MNGFLLLYLCLRESDTAGGVKKPGVDGSQWSGRLETVAARGYRTWLTQWHAGERVLPHGVEVAAARWHGACRQTSSLTSGSQQGPCVGVHHVLGQEEGGQPRSGGATAEAMMPYPCQDRNILGQRPPLLTGCIG